VYVVGKEDAPGIVVLQEWWGVDFEIKNHAVKISQLGPGFKALIPEYTYIYIYICLFLNIVV
jgi:carboxymethylenebutenolidase